MAEAVLQLVLEKLYSFLQTEHGLIWDFRDEMEKLSSKFSTIQAVLQDAERKQLRDEALKNWLRKLKSAAYAVEDIVDDCATEALRLESQSQVPTASLRCYFPGNVVFRHKIGTRIKQITEKLHAIAEERRDFHLTETLAPRQIDAGEMRQTSSIITEQKVYGREDDVELIVELLVNQTSNNYDLSVLPIFGLGGLGKTTLAQLIFNDERVTSHFDLKIWVCVSEDFDVKRIVTAIIESATGRGCENLHLDLLQRRLQEELCDKRYFLVLDDVWNEDQEKWAKLKSVLACSSTDASIITTTRLETAALIMGTLPMHRLSNLSNDHCWLLFKQRAFAEESDKHPNLVKIGKEIVKKCGGVALAAKSLGGLLRFKRREIEWQFVKESDIWNLPQHENSILPALRISYDDLQLDTKQCFTYCAVFPKDHEMEYEDLINLWIANGFISSSRNFEMEDRGREIWDELCWRSFFQDLKKDDFGNVKRFKMHDLVHDLAQSIVVDECYIMDRKNKSNSSFNKNIRHFTLTCSQVSISKVSFKFESLRSLIIIDGHSRSKVSYNLRSRASLRVLHATHFSNGTKTLLSSIGNLRNLKYLNLSKRLSIKALPEAICNLYNLQTLNLNDCEGIKTLPKRLNRLRSLRHLYMKGCPLIRMPPKMGQLACLKTLSVFVVGNGSDYGLSELRNLNLGGSLAIRNINVIKRWEDAKEANLICKQNLRCLSLSWNESGRAEFQENVEQVLQALQPCSNLQELVINDYMGTQFPNWMMMRNSITLQNLQSLRLSGCKNFLRLPPYIGSLPFLRYLYICRMDFMEYLIDDDDAQCTVGSSRKLFPSLVGLIVESLPNLRGLVLRGGGGGGCEEKEGGGAGVILQLAPHLVSMEIIDCSNFVQLPPCLSSLKIRGESNPELLSSISKLGSTLTSLAVISDKEMTYFPEEMLQNLTLLQILKLESLFKLKELPCTKGPNQLVALSSLEIDECLELDSLSEQGLQGLNSLKSLWINRCRSLKYVTEEGTRHLNSLENLVIRKCPELVALTVHGMQNLRYLHIVYCKKLESLPANLGSLIKLQVFTIWFCPKLASIPASIGSLTQLQTLDIINCPKISSLPASIQNLTQLHTLLIRGCPQLKKRCEREDWDKISHISHLCISR